MFNEVLPEDPRTCSIPQMQKDLRSIGSLDLACVVLHQIIPKCEKMIQNCSGGSN
jgi:hypothetical protein